MKNFVIRRFFKSCSVSAILIAVIKIKAEVRLYIANIAAYATSAALSSQIGPAYNYRLQSMPAVTDSGL